jgi:hypothetical protein
MWEAFGDAQNQVSDLNGFCEQRGLMMEVRGNGEPQSQQVRLGNALSSAAIGCSETCASRRPMENRSTKGVTYYRLADDQSQ